MLIQHGLLDMLFLRAAYLLSRGIVKSDPDVIRVITISSTMYPRIALKIAL